MSATAARAYVRTGTAITLVGLVALAGVYVLALKFTPTELRQGLAQKIFYLHVPAAWNALLAFSLVGLCGGLFLWLQRPPARSAGGVIRGGRSRAQGGDADHGADLGQAHLGHLVDLGRAAHADALPLLSLRRLPGAPRRAARPGRARPLQRGRGGAGLLLVPFIHLSVYLFRTLHPQPIVLKPSAPSLPPEMLRTLLVSALVFLVLFIGLVTIRYGLALAEEETEGRLDAA